MAWKLFKNIFNLENIYKVYIVILKNTKFIWYLHKLANSLEEMRLLISTRWDPLIWDCKVTITTKSTLLRVGVFH